MYFPLLCPKLKLFLHNNNNKKARYHLISLLFFTFFLALTKVNFVKVFIFKQRYLPSLLEL